MRHAKGKTQSRQRPALRKRPRNHHIRIFFHEIHAGIAGKIGIRFIDHHDPLESGTDFLHLLQIEQIAGRSIRTRNKEEVRARGLFQHIVRNIEICRQRDPDAFRALKARQRRIQRIRRIETCQRMVFIAETPRQDRQQIVRTVARDDIFRGIAVNGSDLFPQGG